MPHSPLLTIKCACLGFCGEKISLDQNSDDPQSLSRGLRGRPFARKHSHPLALALSRVRAAVTQSMIRVILSLQQEVQELRERVARLEAADAEAHRGRHAGDSAHGKHRPHSSHGAEKLKPSKNKTARKSTSKGSRASRGKPAASGSASD